MNLDRLQSLLPRPRRCQYNPNVKKNAEARGLVELFPLFLKLRGRRCLVVGAGKISEGKIAGLLAAGGKVHVVAPHATPTIEAWDRKKRIRWERRRYEARDLAGAFLVVAATSSNRVHRKIYREARKRGVLCNIVDVPALCDFYYPAVVRRGALQIAISTGGSSPALAKRLREDLEREFGEEYALWLKQLARDRKKIHARKLSAGEKTRLLYEQTSAKAFGKFLKELRGGASVKISR